MRQETAVLFDLGDVLVKLRFERGLSRFVALAGGRLVLPSEAEGLFSSETALAFNRGDIAPEGFFAWVCETLGCPGLPVSACIDAWCDIFDPWPEMESLAEESLAAGHRVYLLSNTDPIHFRYLCEKRPFLTRLSGHCLSFEVRHVKPEAEFFTAALTRFGLAPSGCAFVDDRPSNVEAARALGIPSMVHEGDVEKVRAFLAERGVRLPRGTAIA
jgi:putative hydrolase of the HAD superfamily